MVADQAVDRYSLLQPATTGTLTLEAGKRWARLARVFERNVYGEIPPAPKTLKFECIERGRAFNGVAERRQYVVHSEDACGRHEFRVLLYLPEGTCGKMPEGHGSRG